MKTYIAENPSQPPAFVAAILVAILVLRVSFFFLNSSFKSVALTRCWYRFSVHVSVCACFSDHRSDQQQQCAQYYEVIIHLIFFNS